MQNRLREVDFIRAFAALSVVAIHVTGSYIYSSSGAFLWNLTMRYAVPLFIILSGFVLFQSEKNKKSFSCVTFWSKRLKKILIPYVLWNMIYMIYFSRHDMVKITGNISGFLKDLGINSLTGKGTYHLYFMLIVLQLYLFYPLIRLAARKYMKTTLLVSFGITLYCQTIIYLGVQNKVAIPQTYIPFFMLLPVWVFFFVFGMYFSSNIESLKEKFVGKYIITGALWAISLMILIIDTKLTKTQEISMKPSVIVYSILSFVFFYCVAYKFANTRNPIGRLLDFLSEQSFLIYFSHVLFLDMVVSFSYIAGFGEYWESSRHQVSLYIATVAVSSLFAYIMSYTPVSLLIGGVHKRHLSNFFNKKTDQNVQI